MACGQKPYFCGILLLGSLAVVFHAAGFAAPGWIVMMRDVQTMAVNWQEMALRSEAMMLEMDSRQKIDNGGVMPPMMPDAMDDDDEFHEKSHHDGDSHSHDRPPHHDKPHPPPHHDRPHPPPHHPHGDRMPGEGMHGVEMEEDDDVMEPMMVEGTQLEQWMENIQLDIKDVHIRMSYGLWYSTLCVSEPREEEKIDVTVTGEKIETEEMRVRRHDHDSSSSHKSRKHGKHIKLNCQKISTYCALSKSYLFADFNKLNDKMYSKDMLSYKHMGHASLMEHKIEASIGLSLLVLGLIFGLIAFRKVAGPRCAAMMTVLCMFAGAVLILLPVLRFAGWNHQRHHADKEVKVHAPYSVIISGLGAIFALVTSFVAALGLCDKSRKSGSGNWRKFQNEEEEEEKKGEDKKAPLNFYNDALPVKSGLYDVCDFSGIKPLEAMLETPEKTEA